MKYYAAIKRNDVLLYAPTGQILETLCLVKESKYKKPI